MKFFWNIQHRSYAPWYFAQTFNWPNSTVVFTKQLHFAQIALPKILNCSQIKSSKIYFFLSEKIARCYQATSPPHGSSKHVREQE